MSRATRVKLTGEEPKDLRASETIKVGGGVLEWSKPDEGLTFKYSPAAWEWIEEPAVEPTHPVGANTPFPRPQGF